jgi:DNA-binding phage protein
MTKRTGAAFDQFLAKEMRNAEFRDTYDKQVKLLKSEHKLLTAISRACEQKNVSRSELARRTGKQLPAVSRLLSQSRTTAANPRLATLLEILDALDLQVELRPRRDSRRDVVAVSASL